MLQFILGKPGTGKTTLIHQQIAQIQAEGGENALILIVPEQSSFQTEKALLAATPSGAISRARVLSFNRLSYYVFGRVGGARMAILENSGKHMLLRKIVSGLDGKLQYFKSAGDTKGFLDSLSTTITEFYQYHITPQQLEEHKKGATKEALAMKLNDLHLIYQAYQQHLEDNFICSDAMLDILAEKIPDADFLQGAEIWVDGFKSFTPQEKKVLSALLCVASGVKIALTAPGGLQDAQMITKFDAYHEVADTMRKLTTLGQQLNIQMQTPHICKEFYRHTNAPDLAFLCQNFLGFSSRTYGEVPKNIHIFSGENVFDEIDHAARLITTLTRQRGYKYSQIALVATNLGEYEKFLPAIFARHGIPVFVDARHSAISHPLMEMVFAACGIIAGNWSYEAVFRLLRLPIFTNRDEIDLLENYVLAHNIRGRGWQEYFVRGDEGALLQINTIRRWAVDIMRPLTDKFTQRKKFALEEFGRGIYEFLIANNMPQTLENWMDTAQMHGDNKALREHEQVWGKLMDTLDKMVEILGGQKETIADFAKILEAGIMDLGLAPPSIDQLVLGDLRRSRFGEVKAMVILGAKDGAMPSRPNDAGLFSDEDRDFLVNNGGLTLAKDTTAQICEEEFLIYTGFSKPSHFLAIGYPAGNLEGQGANPSRLLQRIRDLFPGLGQHAMEISSPQGVFGDMLLALGQSAISTRPLHGDFIHTYAHFSGDEYFGKKIDKMRAGLDFAYDTKLSTESVKALYRPNVKTSISKLQRYVSCSFAYFAEYNLRAKPRKIHDVAAADMGNVYHDILAEFGHILKQLGSDCASDEKRVSELVEQVIDGVLDHPANYALRTSGKHMHFAHKMREISKASALALSNHLARGKFDIAYNEVAFGSQRDDGDITMPPIEIELSENAKMLLEGRIDRVDISQIDGAEYVKIIDYKSGAKKFSLDDVYHGLDMQLLMYLGAFIRQMAETQGETAAVKTLPAAALYFNLHNPLLSFDEKLTNPAMLKDELLKKFRMSGLVLDEEAVLTGLDSKNTVDMGERVEKAKITAEGFAALLDHVSHLAKKAGQDILTGKISIYPYKYSNKSEDKTPCTYCDYHTICKFDAGADAHRNLSKLKREEVMEKISNKRQN
ncbi:MAG: PD-(D/E)XK nuclease family protein [Defluviitaleaceae bacterium]|nr:PD-(D/E)XK nuclease family protein [Defluviitaleaceae bacterium]